MSDAPMPTTREIAAACGCGQATVSYALNDNPKIAQATRKRIRAVAESLGWRPNALASAYMAHLRMQKKTQFQATLAFLVAHARDWRTNDKLIHLRRHFAGAKRRAEELGYALEPILINEPGLTARRLNQILRERNIPGLLVPGVKAPREMFREIDWSKFSSVAFSYSLDTVNLNRVSVDAVHGFDLMLRKAVGLGYQRIAVMVSDAYDKVVNHGVHLSAFYAQKKWAPRRAVTVYRFAKSHTDEIPKIKKWLQKERPDAVIGEDVVWQAIQQLQWQSPKDVAFISVDWSPEFPHLAGFNQHHELHGIVAVDMLVGNILQNERGTPDIPRVVLVKGEWADGSSAPPKANPASHSPAKKSAVTKKRPRTP